MKKLYEEDDVQKIADAIRTKTGKSDKMKVGGMPTEISEIVGYTIDQILTGNGITKIASEAVTSLREGACWGMTDITSISLPNLTTCGSYTFSGCSSVNEISLPNLVSCKNYTFSACKSLTKLSLPNLTTCGNYVFSGCSKLTELSLPNLTTCDSYIVTGTPLTKIVLPKLKIMPNSIFNQAKSLKFIDTPALQTVNGMYCFTYCQCEMHWMLRQNTVIPMTSSAALSNSWFASSGKPAYIYVPSVLIDSYKTATNWATYADRFRALEDYTVDGTTTGELDESKI